MMKLAWMLVVVGGINWGLVGLGMLIDGTMDWNLVNMIFGGMPVVEAIVYLVVGVSAVVACCGCKKCKDGKCEEDRKEM